MSQIKEQEIKAEDRVYVFIDGSNLYKGMQSFIGPGSFSPKAINKLAEHLCGPTRRLVRIMYYNSPLKRDDVGYKAQQRFFEGLRRISYLKLQLGHLRKREVKIYCNTCKELLTEAVCKKCKQTLPFIRYMDKGTDVHIATDLLVQAFDNQYDTAILISEDGDFTTAVQEVQRLRKKVENAYFRHRHLASVCDKFTLLDMPLVNSLRP